jgi:lipopolysaccharide assembly protein A
MRIVTWAIRLAVFLLLVAFAAKNVEPVTLRFYFDLALQAPLVLVLFAFFAAGALFGVLALLMPLLRRQRQIAVLKKQASAAEPPAPPVAGL